MPAFFEGQNSDLGVLGLTCAAQPTPQIAAEAIEAEGAVAVPVAIAFAGVVDVVVIVILTTQGKIRPPTGQPFKHDVCNDAITITRSTAK